MWATPSVPLDVLRYIFSFFEPAILLRAALVCRSWNRVASSDELWLAHFQRLGHICSAEHATQVKGMDFGVLNLRDIFLLVLPTAVPIDTIFVHNRSAEMLFLQRPWKPEIRHINFTDWNKFRFHPRRHLGSRSIANIVRLYTCYLRNGEEPFVNMARCIMSENIRPSRKYQSSLAKRFESLLRLSLRLFAFGSLASFFVLVYFCLLSPYRATRWLSRLLALCSSMTCLAAFVPCALPPGKLQLRYVFTLFALAVCLLRDSLAMFLPVRAAVFTMCFLYVLWPETDAQQSPSPILQRLGDALTIAGGVAWIEASVMPVMCIAVEYYVRTRLCSFSLHDHFKIWRGDFTLKLS